MVASHSGLFEIGFIIVIGGALIVGIVKQRKRKKAMQAYALTHGWSQFDATDSSAGMYVPQRIFGKGDWHSYAMGYQLQINGRQAILFEYTNTTRTTDARGESTTTEQEYTVLAFELPGLTSLEILRKSWLHKLDAIGHQTAELHVEGDFNAHFDVLMSEGGQIDALTVLTPDTMALIEDNGTNFNIQIQNGWVVIYGDDKYLSATRINQLTDYAAKLEPELAQKLHQVSPAPTQQTPVSPLSAAPGPST